MARERMGQGMNWPGSESAEVRIGQGPNSRFAPGSKLARKRKGSSPSNNNPTDPNLSNSTYPTPHTFSPALVSHTLPTAIPAASQLVT